MKALPNTILAALLACAVITLWTHHVSFMGKDASLTGSDELRTLDSQISVLEYENEQRSKAIREVIEHAQSKAIAAATTTTTTTITKEEYAVAAQAASEAAGAASLSMAAERSETLAVPSLDTQFGPKHCIEWASRYGVKPGQSWGTLPVELRYRWMQLKCGKLLDNSPQVAELSQKVQPSRSPQGLVPPKAERFASSASSGIRLLPTTAKQSDSYQNIPPTLAEVIAVAPPRGTYKGYTFWSSDFHISPIADLKDLFRPLGMHIIDKSLSGHCHLKKTCAKNIRVLNKGNGIALGRCPNQLRRDFFSAYVRDPAMKKVDAFLCHHAIGLCEVFMPFNKSLIAVASTRFEIGRHDAKRWKLWNNNLRAIAAHPRNIVAANNRYDAEYIKYFTGIKDVPVLPNFCAYTKVNYSPSKPEILIGPGRGINSKLFSELQGRAQKSRFKFARIRDLYAHFEYSDLTKHRAIVLIPYQVSIMSIFEYYRMNIPLFVPDPDLLSKWQLTHRVMGERTWEGVYKRFKAKSAIPQHENSNIPFDPNNEHDQAAIRYWIGFADFYQWPYITRFHDWDDLIAKIEGADLQAVSDKMQSYNSQTKQNLFDTWSAIFHKMFKDIPPAAEKPRPQIMDYDMAMKEMYGAKVSGACVGDSYQ